MTCRMCSACAPKLSSQNRGGDVHPVSAPTWLQQRPLSRVAIAASLLFHAVAFGIVLYAGGGHSATHHSSSVIAVFLSPGKTPATETAPSVMRKNASRVADDNSSASPQQLHANAANHAPQSNQRGASDSLDPLAASGTATVSIPAGYAASNRKPVYPLLSRRQGEEGTVLLHVLVTADGTAETVRIKQSSGYPLLDESALTTVKQWRFRPATIRFQPVSEWYQLAIPFRLE